MLTIRKSLIGVIFSLFSFFCLDVFAQSADLIIQKSGPNQVYVGQYMQYSFSITNNGPDAVTNATWNDNLPGGITNAAFVSCTAGGGAVCPSGGNISISNTSFSGTIPFLPVNGTINMVIEMNAPAPASGSSFSNTATITVPIGTTEVDPSTNSSTWNTTLITKTDIEVQKTESHTTSIACGDLPDTLSYKVLWINHGPSAANGVQLLDYISTNGAVYSGGGNANYAFNYDIFGETWYSSAGTTTPSWTFFQNGPTFTPYSFHQYIGQPGFPNDIAVWEAGDTIILEYKLAIQAPTITGCGSNLDSFNINNIANFNIPSTIQLLDTVSTNNDVNVINRIRLCSTAACPRTDIEVQKTESHTASLACGDLPDTLSYKVLWINHGPSTANGVQLSDYISTNGAVYSGGGNANYAFSYDIFGETWYSSAGTTTPTWTFFQNGPTFTPFQFQQYIGQPGFPNDVAVWEAGDTIILEYKLAIQAPIITGCGRSLDSFNINNIANFNIPSTTQLQDTISTNNSSSVANRIRLCTASDCPKTDIEVQKTESHTASLTCGDLPDTLSYKVLWINHGPGAADGVQLSDYISTNGAIYSGGGNANYAFSYDIFGETWYSSAGTTTPVWTFFQNGSTFTPFQFHQYIGQPGFSNDIATWEAGDTIILEYKLAIQSPSITGCGRNLDSFNIVNIADFNIPNTIQLQDTVSTNNNSQVINKIRLLSAIDMSISKSVSPFILNNGDTLTMTIILQNAPGGATANLASWKDTLPTTFTYLPSTLTCVATGGATCGTVTYNPTTRVLEQINANMPSNSQIVITFRGPVQSLYTVTQTTSARAYQPCIDCVPATNFTQTNFQINGACDSINAGGDQTTGCYQFGQVNMAAIGSGTWTLASGSAGTLNIQNPTDPITLVNSFSNSGNYYLVWTNGICIDTALIVVGSTCNPCNAQFTNNIACAGSTSTFDAATSTPSTDGVILNYFWNFGDGNMSTGQSTTHSYALAGNYNVTLTITDSYGCISSFVTNIDVPGAPVLDGYILRK